MKLPATINVTEQEVDISDTTPAQIAYYEELAKKILSLYKESGEGRQVLGISGPPGSGKSVIVSLLTLFLREQDNSANYLAIGLDGFHWTNDALAQLNLVGVKGRYDTYNVPLLTKKLKAFKAGEEVTFPIYSRTTHNPMPDVITADTNNTLLLFEGQWLLRKAPEWKKIRNFCSYQFAIETEGKEKELRENVIKRHIAGGRRHNEAETFYEESDLVNTQEILKNSVKPDEKLTFYTDI